MIISMMMMINADLKKILSSYTISKIFSNYFLFIEEI